MEIVLIVDRLISWDFYCLKGLSILVDEGIFSSAAAWKIATIWSFFYFLCAVKILRIITIYYYETAHYSDYLMIRSRIRIPLKRGTQQPRCYKDFHSFVVLSLWWMANMSTYINTREWYWKKSFNTNLASAGENYKALYFWWYILHIVYVLTDIN